MSVWAPQGTQNVVKCSSFNTAQKTNGTLRMLTQEHLIEGLFTDTCSEIRTPSRHGEASEEQGQGGVHWGRRVYSPRGGLPSGSWSQTGTHRAKTKVQWGGAGRNKGSSLCPPTFTPQRKPQWAAPGVQSRGRGASGGDQHERRSITRASLLCSCHIGQVTLSPGEAGFWLQRCGLLNCFGRPIPKRCCRHTLYF